MSERAKFWAFFLVVTLVILLLGLAGVGRVYVGPEGEAQQVEDQARELVAREGHAP